MRAVARAPLTCAELIVRLTFLFTTRVVEPLILALATPSGKVAMDLLLVSVLVGIGVRTGAWQIVGPIAGAVVVYDTAAIWAQRRRRRGA